jgi:hypothetical protein
MSPAEVTRMLTSTFALAVLLTVPGAAPQSAHALVTRVSEPAGEGCASGGQRVNVGSDENGDGVLSDAEVSISMLVCDDALARPLERALTRASMPAGLAGLAAALLALLAVVRRRQATVPVRVPGAGFGLQ